MPDIGLDLDTWDLPDRPVIIRGEDLIRQRIRTRLLRGVGEWFVNLKSGLPLLEWRGQKPPDELAISAAIQAEIVQVTGVIATQNFTTSFNPSARSLSVTGEAVLESGQVLPIAATGSGAVERNHAYFLISFGV